MRFATQAEVEEYRKTWVEVCVGCHSFLEVVSVKNFQEAGDALEAGKGVLVILEGDADDFVAQTYVGGAGSTESFSYTVLEPERCPVCKEEGMWVAEVAEEG